MLSDLPEYLKHAINDIEEAIKSLEENKFSDKFAMNLVFEGVYRCLADAQKYAEKINVDIKERAGKLREKLDSLSSSLY